MRPDRDDGEIAGRLGRWLTAALGANEVAVITIERLKGGAVQENWRVGVVADGRPRDLVVRKDSAAPIGESRSRADEFAILKVAQDAGVAVPEPVAFCDDADVLGGPFAVMAFVPGVAFGPRVVKDPRLGGDRTRLLERLGRELARLHRIAPPCAALDFLGKPPANPALAEIERLRHDLDRMRLARPALEWGLRWAERTAPRCQRSVLTHRDFRTGNFLVDEKGLTAILDWEFAGWGDPMADLGWFCGECWRFSRPDLEAGGIGPREALYRGYEAERATSIDDAAVRYWEIVAHLRWAVIALAQGQRHASGAEPSLPLALTGRIATELELAIVRATAPPAWDPRHVG